MNKVRALGEALLDAVLPRRPRDDYRARRPAQPANAFANRSGEIASDQVPPGLSQGEGVRAIPENDDQQEVEAAKARSRC